MVAGCFNDLSNINIAKAEVIEATTTNIHERIKFYAEKYSISAEKMDKTISCETGNTYDPLIQSFVPSKKGPNGREDSWGLAQWNMPAKNKKQDGSLITKEDALNPEITLDTMAWYFSKGKQNKWSCYNIIYEKSLSIM